MPTAKHRPPDDWAAATRACPSCGGTACRLRFEEPPFRIAKCRGCGLVYLLNPPPEEQLYEDYYARSAPDPAAYRLASPDAALAELYAINEQRAEAIQRLRASGDGPGTLLDVGCGRGYFLKTAREAGYAVTGLEVAEHAAAYARRHYGLPVRVGRLASLAGEAAHYDVVTLWHVLEHFVDPFAALGHLRTLLRPGGVCVLEVPNLYSFKFILSGGRWEGGNHPRYHRTFFTAHTLRRALRDAGFARVRRLRLSYRLPGRPALYEGVKRVLNHAALDAFLSFAAWR